MAYSYVEFLGYEIKTSALTTKYMGLENDLHADMLNRVKLMRKAIQTARLCATSLATCLKIFVAPEFFFRGPNGAYSMSQVSAVIGGLQKIVKADTWRDWVFVFGSILGNSSPHDHPDFGERMLRKLFSEDAYQVDATKRKEIYNFVLVQKGGFEDGDASEHARTVMKKVVSGVDFLDPTKATRGLTSGTVTGPPRISKPEENLELQKHNHDGAGIFDLAGIRFGVETCLDHLYDASKGKDFRRLRVAPLSSGQKKVQIHLVPSCGMSIKPGSVVAQRDGFVFNVDGNRPGTDLRKVQTEQLSGNLDAGLFQIDPTAEKEVDFDADALYRAGAGKIVRYIPKLLPDEELVP
ncbi:MAG: hypothetical protein ACOY0T_35465 [Myxococcota bacterium]